MCRGMRMNELQETLFRVIGIARVSKVIPQIPDVAPSPVKGKLIALLLPSLHLLTIVGLLDEALTEYIDVNEVSWPAKTKRDLFNRINVISNIVPELEPTHLHQLRERRNFVAHDPGAFISNPVSWAELDSAIDCVCKSLKALGVIHEIPEIVPFFERTPQLFPDELGPSGERVRHKHVVGAKCDDKIILEFEFEILYLPPHNQRTPQE